MYYYNTIVMVYYVVTMPSTSLRSGENLQVLAGTALTFIPRLFGELALGLSYLWSGSLVVRALEVASRSC
jgi:hypothetical protein